MIALPQEGEDVRLLHRNVSELVDTVNSLLNMTGIWDGKTRGIGRLALLGEEAILTIKAADAGPETGGGIGVVTPLVTVTSNENPAMQGDNIHFIVNVLATGRVAVSIDGNGLGIYDLVGGVAQTEDIDYLTEGSHDITAFYYGDAFNTTATGSMVQRIDIGVTVLVTSSSNPVQPGVNVFWTVDVQPDVTGPDPTGTVDVYIDSVFFQTVTLSGGTGSTGVHLFNVAGSHTISAHYNGDQNYGEEDGTLNQIVFITPVITIVSSVNPVNVGAPVYFTSTVSGGATGTVQFLIDGSLFANVALAGGVAQTPAITTLTAGDHTVLANYTGDGSHNPASISITQHVGVTTDVVITPSSNPGPPNFGIHYDVGVTAPSSPVPTGSVDFYIDGGFFQTVTLSGGHATTGVHSYNVGDHQVHAHYSGDSTYVANDQYLTQHIIGDVTIAFVTDPSPVPPNTQFGVTVHVNAPPGQPVPTGILTFQIDGWVTGTPQTLIGGQAHWDITYMPAGDFTMRSHYSGNQFYNPFDATSPLRVAAAYISIQMWDSYDPNFPSYGWRSWYPRNSFYYQENSHHVIMLYGDVLPVKIALSAPLPPVRIYLNGDLFYVGTVYLIIGGVTITTYPITLQGTPPFVYEVQWIWPGMPTFQGTDNWYMVIDGFNSWPTLQFLRWDDNSVLPMHQLWDNQTVQSEWLTLIVA